ncbi:unnamed protein product [Vitrella brassicaformis CCMP3155]|uniref:Uncharacterized protein n=4 Tax=Vitrella brassicaformis TaxID=1169539 RepID=A0A0G4FW20_VITBC|nr:unnamed protein product [Vitrella brassicaformis CCMP3155]|eukprot:CEM19159.1 unnamed protein product [Vitrella brassicaformis CCMP3155]
MRSLLTRSTGAFGRRGRQDNAGAAASSHSVASCSSADSWVRFICRLVDERHSDIQAEDGLDVGYHSGWERASRRLERLAALPLDDVVELFREIGGHPSISDGAAEMVIEWFGRWLEQTRLVHMYATADERAREQPLPGQPQIPHSLVLAAARGFFSPTRLLLLALLRAIYLSSAHPPGFFTPEPFDMELPRSEGPSDELNPPRTHDGRRDPKRPPSPPSPLPPSSPPTKGGAASEPSVPYRPSQFIRWLLSIAEEQALVVDYRPQPREKERGPTRNPGPPPPAAAAAAAAAAGAASESAGSVCRHMGALDLGDDSRSSSGRGLAVCYALRCLSEPGMAIATLPSLSSLIASAAFSSSAMSDTLPTSPLPPPSRRPSRLHTARSAPPTRPDKASTAGEDCPMLQAQEKQPQDLPPRKSAGVARAAAGSGALPPIPPLPPFAALQAEDGPDLGDPCVSPERRDRRPGRDESLGRSSLPREGPVKPLMLLMGLLMQWLESESEDIEITGRGQARWLRDKGKKGGGGGSDASPQQIMALCSAMASSSSCSDGRRVLHDAQQMLSATAQRYAQYEDDEQELSHGKKKSRAAKHKAASSGSPEPRPRGAHLADDARTGGVSVSQLGQTAKQLRRARYAGCGVVVGRKGGKGGGGDGYYAPPEESEALWVAVATCLARLVRMALSRRASSADSRLERHVLPCLEVLCTMLLSREDLPVAAVRAFVDRLAEGASIALRLGESVPSLRRWPALEVLLDKQRSHVLTRCFRTWCDVQFSLSQISHPSRSSHEARGFVHDVAQDFLAPHMAAVLRPARRRDGDQPHPASQSTVPEEAPDAVALFLNTSCRPPLVNPQSEPSEGLPSEPSRCCWTCLVWTQAVLKLRMAISFSADTQPGLPRGAGQSRAPHDDPMSIRLTDCDIRFHQQRSARHCHVSTRETAEVPTELAWHTLGELYKLLHEVAPHSLSPLPSTWRRRLPLPQGHGPFCAELARALGEVQRRRMAAEMELMAIAIQCLATIHGGRVTIDPPTSPLSPPLGPSDAAQTASIRVSLPATPPLTVGCLPSSGYVDHVARPSRAKAARRGAWASKLAQVKREEGFSEERLDRMIARLWREAPDACTALRDTEAADGVEVYEGLEGGGGLKTIVGLLFAEMATDEALLQELRDPHRLVYRTLLVRCLASLLASGAVDEGSMCDAMPQVPRQTSDHDGDETMDEDGGGQRFRHGLMGLAQFISRVQKLLLFRLQCWVFDRSVVRHYSTHEDEDDDNATIPEDPEDSQPNHRPPPTAPSPFPSPTPPVPSSSLLARDTDGSRPADQHNEDPYAREGPFTAKLDSASPAIREAGGLTAAICINSLLSLIERLMPLCNEGVRAHCNTFLKDVLKGCLPVRSAASDCRRMYRTMQARRSSGGPPRALPISTSSPSLLLGGGLEGMPPTNDRESDTLINLVDDSSESLPADHQPFARKSAPNAKKRARSQASRDDGGGGDGDADGEEVDEQRRGERRLLSFGFAAVGDGSIELECAPVSVKTGNAWLEEGFEAVLRDIVAVCLRHQPVRELPETLGYVISHAALWTGRSAVLHRGVQLEVLEFVSAVLLQQHIFSRVHTLDAHGRPLLSSLCLAFVAKQSGPDIDPAHLFSLRQQRNNNNSSRPSRSATSHQPDSRGRGREREPRTTGEASQAAESLDMDIFKSAGELLQGVAQMTCYVGALYLRADCPVPSRQRSIGDGWRRPDGTTAKHVRQRWVKAAHLLARRALKAFPDSGDGLTPAELHTHQMLRRAANQLEDCLKTLAPHPPLPPPAPPPPPPPPLVRDREPRADSPSRTLSDTPTGTAFFSDLDNHPRRERGERPQAPDDGPDGDEAMAPAAAAPDGHPDSDPREMRRERRAAGIPAPIPDDPPESPDRRMRGRSAHEDGSVSPPPSSVARPARSEGAADRGRKSSRGGRGRGKSKPGQRGGARRGPGRPRTKKDDDADGYEALRGFLDYEGNEEGMLASSGSDSGGEGRARRGKKAGATDPAKAEDPVRVFKKARMSSHWSTFIDSLTR